MSNPEGELGLSDKLREAIRRSGKSLNQLSKECGVGSDRLSRFMRGQRDLTLSAAEKIFTALHLKVVGEPPITPTPKAERPKGRGRK